MRFFFICNFIFVRISYLALVPWLKTILAIDPQACPAGSEALGETHFARWDDMPPAFNTGPPLPAPSVCYLEIFRMLLLRYQIILSKCSSFSITVARINPTGRLNEARHRYAIMLFYSICNSQFSAPESNC